MSALSVRSGVDLVHIPRLARLAEEPAFIERAFHPAELADGSLQHLAGVLAAKEALFKALDLRPSWHAVEILRGPHGRPTVRLGGSLGHLPIRWVDLSVSHDGDYAVAVAIVLLGGE